jgi:alanine-glyoxylate transaminase/serine-glyoxylate transaminase/serine-pyruvate transaminase
MEACFVNLIPPGYGHRVPERRLRRTHAENVERCGATAVMVQDDWGSAVDPNKVEEALRAPGGRGPGLRARRDLHRRPQRCRDPVRLAREHDALVIMDTVTSLGGIELKVDDWGADAVYSGSQKCLSCVPGISPVTFSPRAVERIRARSKRYRAGSSTCSWSWVTGAATASAAITTRRR